jgi:hypothetical protein
MLLEDVIDRPEASGEAEQKAAAEDDNELRKGHRWRGEEVDGNPARCMDRSMRAASASMRRCWRVWRPEVTHEPRPRQAVHRTIRVRMLMGVERGDGCMVEVAMEGPLRAPGIRPAL